MAPIIDPRRKADEQVDDSYQDDALQRLTGLVAKKRAVLINKNALVFVFFIGADIKWVELRVHELQR